MAACCPVAGTLPAAVTAVALGRDLICPQACGGEAAWAGDLEVLAPASLLALLNHFKGSQVLSPPEPKASESAGNHLDLRDIKGQESAKRALEVAAAGGHNILMSGPPGSGKSMLAQRLPGLLPPLSAAEALEVSMIASVAGLTHGRLLSERPFRAPHHSCSVAALVGGGSRAHPGEVSLAHRGVLFLDEFPEFQRASLEALRQPLEAGTAVIARANAHTTYPARFQLVAAMNPCRCGYLHDPARSCSRAPHCGLDYQAKLSGPLLDRIDLFVEVPDVSASDLTLPPAREGSREAAARVARARARQKHRQAELQNGASAQAGGDGRSDTTPPPSTNAELDTQALERVVQLDDRGRTLLSARSSR